MLNQPENKINVYVEHGAYVVDLYTRCSSYFSVSLAYSRKYKLALKRAKSELQKHIRELDKLIEEKENE